MPLLVTPQNPPGHQPFRSGLFLLSGIFILLFGLWIWLEPEYRNPVIFDDQGNPQLVPDRKAKRDRKLRELEEAEQYVLLAAKDGWYECFSCPDTGFIFLKMGEVWKYGFTTKQNARYPKRFYQARSLKYKTQFEGTIEQCMQREIQMIYDYPLLPEVLARPIILVRPPGNKKDT